MTEETATETESPVSTIGKFYETLEILAPGDNAVTKEAFQKVGPMPTKPKILDIGSGTGRVALALAEACPDAEIDVVDSNQGFLDKCVARAQAKGIKVNPIHLDMERVADELPPRSYDLIWSEGAAYMMSFEKAAKTWRVPLKLEAPIVISELCWLTDSPPKEAETFWVEAYPEISTIDETIVRADRAGLKVFDKIVLPKEAWDAYYGPLEARCKELLPTADAQTKVYIKATMQEIEIYKKYPGSYGYVLFLMRRK